MLNVNTPNVDPLFVSIDDVARLTGESTWQVKQHLRAGIYRAKKSGRRTLVDFVSVKARAENLPDAKLAPPRKRSKRQAAQSAEAR